MNPKPEKSPLVTAMFFKPDIVAQDAVALATQQMKDWHHDRAARDRERIDRLEKLARVVKNVNEDHARMVIEIPIKGGCTLREAIDAAMKEDK